MTETCVLCGEHQAREVCEDLKVKTPEGEILIKDDRRMVCSSGACDDYYTSEQSAARDVKVQAARKAIVDSYDWNDLVDHS